MYINQRFIYLFMFYDFKSQLFQYSHCNVLYFKDEMIQSNKHYFFYCLNNFIKFFSLCSMLFYLKDFFIIKTLEVKHFQQQINIYNNAMIFIFCIFNQNECLNHSVSNIQLFIICEKLYHLQKLLQHSFMYVSLFT